MVQRARKDPLDLLGPLGRMDPKAPKETKVRKVTKVRKELRDLPDLSARQVVLVLKGTKVNKDRLAPPDPLGRTAPQVPQAHQVAALGQTASPRPTRT